MFTLDIPGFGVVELRYLITDFSGTLAKDGDLIKGVKERLLKVSKILKVHILTADTFGTALNKLAGMGCNIKVLQGERIDLQKENFVRDLGSEHVIAFGNGLNDRYMLKIARIGVVVINEEGCSLETLKNADIVVKNIVDAFDLILKPKRLKATLRF